MVGRWWRSRSGRWLPLLLWMAAIYVLSDQPKSGIPSFGVWDWLVKKGSHFLAYGVLSGLAWRVFGERKRPLRRRTAVVRVQCKPYLLAFLLTVLYAASDEFHQTFIPGRNGTLVDVLIDSLGGLTALFILRKNWFRLPGFLTQSNQSP